MGLVTPPSSPTSADELVYDAEEAWVHQLRDAVPSSPLLARLTSTADAEDLAHRFAMAAGCRLGSITVEFKITDEDWRGACVAGAGLIHIRPLAEAWTLAHEVAHVVSSTLDHGGRFLGPYLEIVTVHGGPRAVRSLRDQLRRHGAASFDAGGRWLGPTAGASSPTRGVRA